MSRKVQKITEKTLAIEQSIYMHEYSNGQFGLKYLRRVIRQP